MQSSTRNGGRAPSALSPLLSIGCKSIAVSVAALVLAACGAKPNAHFVGAWEEGTHTLAFQLAENGTGVALDEGLHGTASVTYTLADADTVVLSVGDQKMIFHYDAAKDRLVDTTRKLVYVRIAALPKR